ncbi:MAG: SH3 domain-containing protein [Lachnospiraceae bacterium]|nr:SH3 domain-containing protein [Lachnospiraceae bacterium]
MKKYAGHIILAVVIVILAVAIVGMYFNKQESTNLNNSVETSEYIAIDTPEPTAELILEPTVEPVATVEPTSTPEPTPEPTPAVEEEKSRQSYITRTEDGYEYDFLLEFAGIIAGSFGVSNEDMIAYVETNIEELYNMEENSDVDRALFQYAKTLPSWQDGIVPMDAIMYAQSSVNVRIGHSADYEKIGSLTTNQEVAVTGQSSETGWYRIEFEGGIGYVSDAYLGPNMVEVPETDVATPGTNSGSVNSDSTCISERNGYQVGDQMIIGMYTSVTYQGGDVWMTEDSRAYTVVKDNGNGYIEFAPGIFAKPGEQPVSERVGYQPGDTMLCHSLGYDFNRVYVGNDIWYDDNDPDTMLIASLQNGKLVFTTYDW